MYILPLCVFVLTWLADLTKADTPCAPRPVTGQSVLCVCNATYCDDLIRDAPAAGSYVSYTSSEGGLRFEKSTKKLQHSKPTTERRTTVLEIFPDTRYQTIEGFGGAVTDATGMHWKNLSEPLQEYMIKSYFGDDGLQYNMLRVPIGGTDFSTHGYAYNETPENDTMLNNFTLSYEDYQFKIPMIKAILDVSSTPVHIVSSTWSPPLWMKTSNKYDGRNRLRPEYYQTYALYHYKFLEKYADQNITIWGITTTNEPLNGLALGLISCLGWTYNEMGQWIVNNLGPVIRNSVFRDVKIIALDDQRYAIPLWFNKMMENQPNVSQYIDGVAVHYYGDVITPASYLSDVGKKYPGKFVLATEACEGSYPWQEKVVLGSWSRAKNYIIDIIEDLNHNVIGWIDWNLCLNENGGPNWYKNYVDSPVIVYPEQNEFVKQPMFYAIGHFAKFVPRGSRRVEVTESKPILESSIYNVAFVTPRNTVVAVLYNNCDNVRKVTLKLGTQQAPIEMQPNSVVTMEIPYAEQE